MTIIDMWEFVINRWNDVTEPTKYITITNNQMTQLKESIENDAKALSLIDATMIEAFFPKMTLANYLKEAWDILETNFKGIDKFQVVKL